MGLASGVVGLLEGHGYLVKMYYKKSACNMFDLMIMVRRSA